MVRAWTFPADVDPVAAMNPCPCGYRSTIRKAIAALDLRRSCSARARVMQGIPENTWGFKENGGSMVFDVEEYEAAKYGYMHTLLDAVDEAQKSGGDSANFASLSEVEITERSGLPRQLVERLSDEFSNGGLIECLGGVGPPKGRSYCFTAEGLTHAEKLRYDKSGLAKRRKAGKLAIAVAKEVSRSVWTNVASGLGGWMAGLLMGYKWGDAVVHWIRSLFTH